MYLMTSEACEMSTAKREVSIGSTGGAISGWRAAKTFRLEKDGALASRRGAVAWARDRGRGTHLSWPLSRIGRMAAGLELPSGSAPGGKGGVGPERGENT